MLFRAISANALILTAFALCTAALLAGTWLVTHERIAESKRRAAEKALLEIVPADQHDNDILSDVFVTSEELQNALGLKNAEDIHIARKYGKIVAYIYPATAPDGYSGDIDLIIGVNVDGSIAGVRVLAHKETPGLGDKVDLKKSQWILSFKGHSLNNPGEDRWLVKKDGGIFDQFTGATITPRAVVKRVKETLKVHRDLMMQMAEEDAAKKSEALQ